MVDLIEAAPNVLPKLHMLYLTEVCVCPSQCNCFGIRLVPEGVFLEFIQGFAIDVHISMRSPESHHRWKGDQ